MRYRLSKVYINWTPNFAYAIGLITTDGNLSSDGRHLNLTSKDEAIITNFRACLNLSNKIGRKSRGRNQDKIYFVLQFGDKNFYEFLLSIGLKPAKSKILKSINIPREFFCDFLRGCIDGDGNLSITHHPESKNLQLRVRLASASNDFLLWIKDEIKTVLPVIGGSIEKKKSVFCLSFGKEDSRKILGFIYYDEVKYFLLRKRHVWSNFCPSGGTGIRA